MPLCAIVVLLPRRLSGSILSVGQSLLQHAQRPQTQIFLRDQLAREADASLFVGFNDLSENHFGFAVALQRLQQIRQLDADIAVIRAA